jgi:hypothetical protein
MNSLVPTRFLIAVMLVAACSSASKPPVGSTCLKNTDCASPLVCTFGRCHTACTEARDCPAGQLCVKGADGTGCQLPTEAHCLYRSDCAAPLTCALDRQCRVECQTDVDCATRSQLCVMPDQVCAEPEEVDANTHRLRNAQPGQPAPDAAAPDASAADAAAPDAAPADGLAQSCTPGTTMCSGQKQATCMGGLWVVANSDCAQGCDQMAGACRVCPTATCRSVRVVFHGAVSNQADVQLAVDDGKVIRTASDTDPLIGQQTLLFGNFTDDKKQYTSDNTACSLPSYGPRTNVYYLAPTGPLAVASSWYGGADDFKDQQYCQSCPNFGCDNLISTPKRIDKIEVLANSGDATCRVCLYRAGGPSAATLIRCLPPNTSLSGMELDPMVAPALLDLDNGQRCGSY